MDATDTLGWEDHAECHQHDPEIWHTRDTAGTALHICHTHCPVRDACNTWARRIGGWADLAVGGEWWVRARGQNRPTAQPIVHDTVLCRTCRGDQAQTLGPQPPPVCGTLKGFYRHRDHNEPIDDACRDAYRAWDRQYRRGRRAVLRSA